MINFTDFVLKNIMHHLIPMDKVQSLKDYVRLFYSKEKKFRGQDIGKLISPDMPLTFKYFMEEFEDRLLFINFETLINILNSISLSDQEKIKWLEPFSLKKDINSCLRARKQNLNFATGVEFDVWKTFQMPKYNIFTALNLYDHSSLYVEFIDPNTYVEVSQMS